MPKIPGINSKQTVREAFRLLQEKERRFESLRTDVKAGFDQLDRGEGIELDNDGLRDFFDDIQARGQRRYELATKVAVPATAKLVNSHVLQPPVRRLNG